MTSKLLLGAFLWKKKTTPFGCASRKILGWRSSFGYELGTTKAFAEPESAVQRLGLGLQPVERIGVLTFEPRSFNLSWIKRGNPWSLTFEAQTGVQVASGVSVVSNSFVNAVGGTGLPLTRITFP